LRKDFSDLCINLAEIPKPVLPFGKLILQQPTVRYGLVSLPSPTVTFTLAIPKQYSSTLDTPPITVGRLICDTTIRIQRPKSRNILRRYWRWYGG
jgi:hypothetical protein